MNRRVVSEMGQRQERSVQNKTFMKSIPEHHLVSCASNIRLSLLQEVFIDQKRKEFSMKAKTTNCTSDEEIYEIKAYEKLDRTLDTSSMTVCDDTHNVRKDRNDSISGNYNHVNLSHLEKRKRALRLLHSLSQKLQLFEYEDDEYEHLTKLHNAQFEVQVEENT